MYNLETYNKTKKYKIIKKLILPFKTRGLNFFTP